MEEDKIQEELKEIKKELNAINKKMGISRKEGSYISFISLSIAFGLPLMMYSIEQLNKALNVKFEVWNAWLGIVAGIFIILIPFMISGSVKYSRKRKSQKTEV